MITWRGETKSMYIICYVCSWGRESIWFKHDSWDFHSSRFSCLLPLNLVSVNFMNECQDLPTSGCCWLSKTDAPGNCFFDATAYEASCTLYLRFGILPNCQLPPYWQSVGQSQRLQPILFALLHTRTDTHYAMSSFFPFNSISHFLTLHSWSHTVLLKFSRALLLISDCRAPLPCSQNHLYPRPHREVSDSPAELLHICQRVSHYILCLRFPHEILPPF